MIIGLFGLSGSGKSHVSKDFKSSNTDFYCTSASKILSSIDRPIELDKIDKVILDKNQEALPNLLKELHKENPNILIELHAVIENQDSTFYKVNKDVLLALELDYVFLLNISEKTILKQRLNDKNKNRRKISLDDLIKLNHLQKDYLLQIYGENVNTINNCQDLEKKLKKHQY